MKKYSKERFIFLMLLFSFLIIKNLPFNNSIVWKKNKKSSSYIYSGKYNLSKISKDELDNLPKISKKDAELIIKNREKILKSKDFSIIKGIGFKKDKTLKKFVNFK